MASQAAGVALAPAHAPDHTAPEFRPAESAATSASGSRELVGGAVGSEKEEVVRVDTVSTTMTQLKESGSASDEEDGRLFHPDGRLVLMPAATADPNDPLNWPMRRKVLALTCLCLFGALAASAELILGAMLPVFALQYAGIDPKILETLSENGGLPGGTSPLEYLAELPNAPPIWETYMLSSVPILVMGVSNMFLVPLSIAVGRRPVVLACGVIAIAGALWSGYSQSLGSHIGGRCLQALGAGTVESVIPFIIQDMVYFHQRNTAISGCFAAQGFIIIVLGIASPYAIIYLNWRYVYYITAAGAAFFLVGVILFLPETKWNRTPAEIKGTPRREAPGAVYQRRSLLSDITLAKPPFEWARGWVAFVDVLRTFFYPQIFFITMLNSAMIACGLATAYTASPALLSAPYAWPFLHLGLCLVPVLISAAFVAGLTGRGADWVANAFAKRRGRRLPENQLINMVLPILSALVGSVLFGVCADNEDKYPWPLFLFAFGLCTFGFLGANTVGAVYVLECYPQLAGPALVNIASFRCILAFALSFRVSEWIADWGYTRSMVIYTGLMGGFALFLPVVYKWGPAWRRRWPGPDR